MLFTDWTAANLIPAQLAPGQSYVYDIPAWGRLLVLRGVIYKDQGSAHHILLTPEMVFSVSKAEKQILADDPTIKYFAFEFGYSWYYAPVVVVRNDDQVSGYRVEFNDLLYLGQLEQALDFVHLGLHTEYELLNSALNFKAAIKKAKFLGQRALGMCDRNTLGGVLGFQLECLAQGIKPVLGMTLTVARLAPDPTAQPLLYGGKVYAVNEAGWHNLLAISAVVNRNPEAPYIVEDELLTLGSGLAWVFNYENGILRDQRDPALYLRTIKRYQRAFWAAYQQFTVVTYTDPEFDLRALRGAQYHLQKYANILPPIYLDDIHYLNPAEATIKTTLNKIAGTVQTESLDMYMRAEEAVLDAATALFTADKEYCRIPADELIVQMLQHAADLVDAVDFSIPTGQHRLPKFPYQDSKVLIKGKPPVSSDLLFRKLVRLGFKSKVLGDKRILSAQYDAYAARLVEELEVITSAGFSDYFLILWDIIASEREAGGLIGPGRGSVGGSLIAYLLDITQVDPVKYDLLFERFLNKTRVSGERAKMADAMPDVDVDFESARRDIVKAYISTKYGRDYVCSVGSYTRMKLKGALKSLCRVKGLSFKYVNDLTADIDNQLEYSFRDLVTYAGTSTKLYAFMQQHPDVVETLKVVLNNPSVTSVHPSAVIIVPRHDSEGRPTDIYKWLPIREVGGLLVTEWEGKYTDRGGFLKEDILGIGQLDKFKYILKLIKDNTGKDIDLNTLSLTHKPTFKLFTKGFNVDVFQFGSYGLKAYSTEVKPNCIDDIIAMNALYRPGPMESDAHRLFGYIKNGVIDRTTGEVHVPKYDYGLEAVTRATSGLYVYQEQIMRAVHELGGLTLSEADEVRTVMKKFDQKKMATFQAKFMAGAIERGCSPAEGEIIWEKLRAFSKYGFNKSHAAAYGLIAYWCQWLKANHPLEFWAAAFNFVAHVDKIPRFIEEVKRINETIPPDDRITINTPDVNFSTDKFVALPADRGIYWSFGQIKGIGPAVSTALQNMRTERGKFFDLEDFVNRCKGNKVNKAAIRALILSGGFDKMYDIHPDHPQGRRQVLMDLYALRKEDPADDPFTHLTDLTRKSYHWMRKQRELIGYAELDYRSILESSDDITQPMVDNYLTARDLRRLELPEGRYGPTASVAGFLVKIVPRKTKAGDAYAVMELDNNSETIEIVIWPESWAVWGPRVEGYLGHMLLFYGSVMADKYRGEKVGMYSNRDKTNIVIL